MKKTIILFALSFIVAISHAQTAKDFFNSSSKVTWLGLDFSNVQLIGEFAQFGEAGNNTTDEVRDKYFPAWNNLFYTEADKYNVSDMIRNTDVDIKIEVISDLNKNADSKKLRTYDAKTYSAEEIQSFVKKYDLKGEKGIGLVFIAETLNKDEQIAFYHFVVINMNTKKVLFQERLAGEPGGFGVRNYWAKSFYNVMKDVEKKYFKRWGKDYK